MNGIDIGKLFGKSNELSMPKMPMRGGSVKVEIEQESEPEGDMGEDDDESTRESIGFTDATQRCGQCEHHDGSSCAMYAILCGPQDGCRVGFEPRSGAATGGLTIGEEEGAPPNEVVP